MFIRADLEDEPGGEGEISFGQGDDRLPTSSGNPIVSAE